MIWTGESNGRELRYGQPRNFQRSPNSITVGKMRSAVHIACVGQWKMCVYKFVTP